MQITESTLELENGALRLRRQGEGPPLVFLHGAHGMNTWPRYLERLSATHEVIVPDLPGFGQSGASKTTTRVHDIARVMLDLLDTLRPGEVVDLAGHCLGGWVALEMAVRGARLRSLTLLNAAGIHVDGVRKGDFFIVSPDELPALLFADPRAGETWLHAETASDFESAVFQNRQMAARLAWSPRLFDPELAKWLRRIAVPTRVIWGDRNQILPPVMGEALAERTSSSLHVISAAGHMAHIEQAEACAQATLAHLREAAGQTAPAPNASRGI